VTSEEWARTSISVDDANDPAKRLAEVTFSDSTLERQLAEAEVWITANVPALLTGARTPPSVRLFCSWTPLQGQRAMTLPATLIRAMADVGCYFWMDFYSPDEK
jgi:hypothetical protein